MRSAALLLLLVLSGCASYRSASFCPQALYYDLSPAGASYTVKVTERLVQFSDAEAKELVAKIPGFKPFDGVCWYSTANETELNMSMGRHNNLKRYTFVKKNGSWVYDTTWEWSH